MNTNVQPQGAIPPQRVIPPEAVVMRGIVKRFGDLTALDQVDFVARRGEISVLLGENGAGKSTLMQILSGLYRPDAGQLLIDNVPVNKLSPARAIALGVGMVYQHFQLVDSLTVAGNILLGTSSPRFYLPANAAYDEIRALAENSHLPIDPGALLWTLSVGEKQRVEILKALWRGARIIILDEPTAVLTALEVQPFFSALRRLAAQGTAIILITHKLDEVMSVADRISVLRRGQMRAHDLLGSQTSRQKIEQLIIGSDTAMATVKRASTPHIDAKKNLLQLRDVDVLGERGLLALKKINLSIKAGEILGLAGVSGNGQRELAELLAGLRRPQSGSISLDGQDLSTASASARQRLGLAFVPEDRETQGLAPGLSVLTNLSLRAYREPPHGFVLRLAELKNRAQQLVDKADIRLRSLHQPAGQLSGGNAQKLILAREISARPRLLVAAQPTRGLDFAAAAAIRSQLAALADQGAAVLLISEDLDEILALADRIVVLFAGSVVGNLSRERFAIKRIAALMLGSVEEKS